MRREVEFVQLLRTPGVHVVDFHQCEHGADSVKPTRVVFWGVNLGALEAECSHPPRWWQSEYCDNSGKPKTTWEHAPHPRLVRKRGSDGAWASKAAAAYPGPLNLAIVRAVVGQPLE